MSYVSVWNQKNIIHGSDQSKFDYDTLRVMSVYEIKRTLSTAQIKVSLTMIL